MRSNPLIGEMSNSDLPICTLQAQDETGAAVRAKEMSISESESRIVFAQKTSLILKIQYCVTLFQPAKFGINTKILRSYNSAEQFNPRRFIWAKKRAKLALRHLFQSALTARDKRGGRQENSSRRLGRPVRAFLSPPRTKGASCESRQSTKFAHYFEHTNLLALKLLLL